MAKDNIRSLMFGDYLSKGKDERLYDEIQNLEELRQVGCSCCCIWGFMAKDNIRSLMLGDNLSKGKDERLYDEIQNLEELRQVGCSCCCIWGLQPTTISAV